MQNDLAKTPGGENIQFLLKEETHRIIGCGFEVLKRNGHGLYEKIYENSLVVEFGLQGIAWNQQRRFDVLYKKQPVGFYIPDLIVFGQVIVDCKTIDRITEEERGKMINYLKIIWAARRPDPQLPSIPNSNLNALSGKKGRIESLTDGHR